MCLSGGKMFNVLMISVSLEIASGYAAVQAAAVTPWLMAFVAHWAGCALFAYAAAKLSSCEDGQAGGADAALFFALSFFVPLLGLVGVCCVLPRFRSGSAAQAVPTLALRTSEAKLLPEAPVRLQAGAGPANLGMLVSALRHAPDSSRRAAAILATLRLPDQDAINILRVALGDPEDDIRLLAYALLAQMDKRYNDSIQADVARLRHLPPGQEFLLCKQIAQQYWELAWVGLARGESVAPILNKALEYVGMGLAVCAEDAGLCLLHGKILLRLKRYDEAYGAFSRAEASGADRHTMALYLAEIAFYRRQFATVVGHLEQTRPELRSGKATGVRSYWQEASYAA